MKSSLSISLLSLTFILASCTPAPERELSQARESLRRAVAEDALLYAPAAWREARTALQEAESALSAERRRTAYTRDYAQARFLLVRARNRGEKAASEAQRNRQEAASTARRVYENTVQSVQVANGLLGAALDTDRRRPALEKPAAHLSRLNVSLFMIQQDLQEGRFTSVDELREIELEAARLAPVIKEEHQEARLWEKVETFETRGLHVVVDIDANRLYLREDQKVLMKAACSTGSGTQLAGRGRSWTFETPQGRFRILNKIEDPVWRRPDWAFLEEGKPVPANENDRYMRGVLGQYALGFAPSHFIHGTLYEDRLGESVTHGCIRLGSHDLAFLAERVSKGTPVYIIGDQWPE